MKLIHLGPVRVQTDDGKIYTVLHPSWLGFETILDEDGKGISSTRDLGVNILRFVRAELNSKSI